MSTKHEQMIEFQQRLINSAQWRTCLNCLDWDKKKLECGRYKMVPPLEVIVVSCPNWEMDIPF